MTVYTNPFLYRAELIEAYEGLLGAGNLTDDKATSTRMRITELRNDIANIDDASYIHAPELEQFGDEALNRVIETTQGSIPYRETMLTVAARALDKEAVERLLELGADPNVGDPSPLMVIGGSFGGWRLEIAQSLVEAGADVNFVSSRGGTALTTVARFTKDYVLAQYLLDCGADPTLGTPRKVEHLRKFMETNGLQLPASSPKP
jgi:ankyrin repeat protein